MHTTKVKACIAAALLLCVTLCFWAIMESLPREDSLISFTGDEKEDGLGEHSKTAGFREPGKARLVPQGHAFSGWITDTVTGEPIPAFEIGLTRDEGLGRAIPVAWDRITDEKGGFTFPIDQGGVHALTVWARGYCRRNMEVEIPPDHGLEDLWVSLDPVQILSGKVVDGTTSLPVEGAFVIAEPLDAEITTGYDGGVDTDGQGRFTLEGLGAGKYRITACHVDYEEGMVEASCTTREIRIPLRKQMEYFVFGTVCDDQGLPMAGIKVRLSHDTHPGALGDQVVYTDESGDYAMLPVSPGGVELFASRAFHDMRKRKFTNERKGVKLVDRNREVNFGPTSEHVTWTGKVYGFDGNPMPSIGMYICPLLPEMNDEYWGECTAPDGSFEINKLTIGSYQVTLYLGDTEGSHLMNRYTPEEVVFENPGNVKKDIHLSGEALKGMIVDEETGKSLAGFYGRVEAVLTGGSDRFHRSFEIRLFGSSEFFFKGLSPGQYTITVEGDEHAAVMVDNVILNKGQGTKEMRVAVPRSGLCEIELVKCGHRNRTDQRDLVLRMDPLESNGEDFQIRSSIYPKRSRWRFNSPFAAGTWKLTVDVEELGRVEKWVEIYDKNNTHVVIQGKDFPDYKEVDNPDSE